MQTHARTRNTEDATHLTTHLLWLPILTTEPPAPPPSGAQEQHQVDLLFAAISQGVRVHFISLADHAAQRRLGRACQRADVAYWNLPERTSNRFQSQTTQNISGAFLVAQGTVTPALEVDLAQYSDSSPAAKQLAVDIDQAMARMNQGWTEAWAEYAQQMDLAEAEAKVEAEGQPRVEVRVGC